MENKLQLRYPHLLNFGPNVIGGTGGSGTRVVARIVQKGGMFIGVNRAPSEDVVPMQRYKHLTSFFISQKSSFQSNTADYNTLEELTSSGFYDFVQNRWTQKLIANQLFSEPIEDSEMMQILKHLKLSIKDHLSPLIEAEVNQPWGWKQPASIFILPFLHSQFSQIKCLHLIRDGRDMAFSKNQQQTQWLGSIVLSAEEQRWNQPLQSIALWNRVNLMSAEYGDRHMPGQYLRIRFEDLCSQPMETIKQIFDFFGLQGNIAQIAEEEVKPPKSLGRWRSQDAKTIEDLEEIGQPALQNFGYLG